MTFARASGILLHPTSLPGPHGIGDLGDNAYRFADFLSAGIAPLPCVTIRTRLRVLVMFAFVRHHSAFVRFGVLYNSPDGVCARPSAP